MIVGCTNIKYSATLREPISLKTGGKVSETYLLRQQWCSMPLHYLDKANKPCVRLAVQHYIMEAISFILQQIKGGNFEQHEQEV